MKSIQSFLFLLLLTNFCSTAYATWSVIIIDPKTKEIGIAGASCSYNCYGIGEIIPGMGAVIVQAMSNSDARDKGVQMILAEASPAEIIQAMSDPSFDPEKQQYAVVTVKYISEPATYTGNAATTFNGALTETGVAVQGNTLANLNELQAVLAAVRKGKKDLLTMAETLMRALEAGSISGGDKRCGAQKATSAFITIAKPGNKKPYLNLNIFGQPKGGQNAVEMIRKKFEKWEAKQHGN
ncbi:MAG: DUF1028 domain-containing protein [Chitinophagaceae bacterium]